MTVPALETTTTAPTELDVDVLALAVSATPDGPVLRTDAPEFAALAAGLRAIGVSGGVDEVVRVPAVAGIAARAVALVGIGSGTPTPDAWRTASGTLTRQLRGVTSVGVAFGADAPAEVAAVLEGAALGAYAFTGRKTKRGDGPATRVVVVGEATDAQVHHAAVTAESVHVVRDLVNTPPNDLYPETFAERVLELVDGTGLEVEVLDVPALEAGGFGGILGVGAGSVRPPRMVVVRHRPQGASGHLALVGKGITFDSGGLSLKPAASMVGMKYDMTGAATVFAVALAAAKLDLPVQVTAWLCLAENMPSGQATRPNDVITIRGGTTVEVLNTDAEGRLVLADGIVAASEEAPDAIVDVATLTGAARVALGNRTAGLMGDDVLVQQVRDAATRTGELVWPMPLPGELRAVLNSDVADIANARPGNTAAGMLLAATFLRDFVGSVGEGAEARRIPWAHLDIAGPANNDGAGYGYVGKGSTGITVRALLNLTEEFSADV